MDIKQMEKALSEALEVLKAKAVEFSAKGSEIDSIKATMGGLTDQLASVRKAMDDNMVAGQRPGFGGSGLAMLAKAYKSPGQVIFEDESFQSAVKSGAKNIAPVKVGGGFLGHFKALRAGYGRKDLSGAVSSSTAGALLIEQHLPGAIMAPNRMPRLREVIPSQPTAAQSIEYVEETAFNQLYTQLSAALAAPGDTITVYNVSGFYIGQSVTLAPGNPVLEETLTVLAITPDAGNGGPGDIQFSASTANAHVAETALVSDTFVFTSETVLKPKARPTYTAITTNVKTLAHWLPATRQILADAPGLRAMLDGRLVEGLLLNEERQLLYGDGSTDQLQGIMTHPSAQTYAQSSGPASDTKADAVRRAMNLSALAHYPVDAVVLHPTDWTDIELAKSATDGHYMIAPLMFGDTILAMWRVPVIVTTAIDVTDFLVGAFNLGCAIFDREDAQILVSESHEDFFVRNMVAVLAEERLAFAIFRPDSFVVGEFDV